ncbi:hypothetical protein VNO77_17043 [Canavalia gladiata]|uniref:Uncharacterized protein n=1 Tax=Canavalia gladiata TaxID=3824 RepID=A0AAN9QJ15_CANGL
MLTSIGSGYGTIVMLPRLLRGLLLAPLGLRGSEIGPTKTKFERSSALSVPRNTNEACTAHDVHKNLSPGMKSENLKLHYVGKLDFKTSLFAKTQLVQNLFFFTLMITHLHLSNHLVILSLDKETVVCKGVQAELLGVDREMDWMILLQCEEIVTGDDLYDGSDSFKKIAEMAHSHGARVGGQ